MTLFPPPTFDFLPRVASLWKIFDLFPQKAIKQYIIRLNSGKLCCSNQISPFGTVQSVKFSKKNFSRGHATLLATFWLVSWSVGWSISPSVGLSVRGLVRHKVTFRGFPLLPTCLRLMLPCIWPCSQDVWALGCLLFLLCFRSHPYEDSAKLRIINAKYSIPANDSRYRIFHELIHRMFRVGKKLLPYRPRSSFLSFSLPDEN